MLFELIEIKIFIIIINIILHRLGANFNQIPVNCPYRAKTRWGAAGRGSDLIADCGYLETIRGTDQWLWPTTRPGPPTTFPTHSAAQSTTGDIIIIAMTSFG